MGALAVGATPALAQTGSCAAALANLREAVELYTTVEDGPPPDLAALYGIYISSLDEYLCPGSERTIDSPEQIDGRSDFELTPAAGGGAPTVRLREPGPPSRPAKTPAPSEAPTPPEPTPAAAAPGASPGAGAPGSPPGAGAPGSPPGAGAPGSPPGGGGLGAALGEAIGAAIDDMDIPGYQRPGSTPATQPPAGPTPAPATPARAPRTLTPAPGGTHSAPGGAPAAAPTYTPPVSGSTGAPRAGAGSPVTGGGGGGVPAKAGGGRAPWLLVLALLVAASGGLVAAILRRRRGPLAGSSSGAAKLEVRLPKGEPRAVTLSGLPVEIGRDPDCGLLIDDPAVSRRHARLEIRAGQLWIVDLDSTAGIQVDGGKVASARLEAGSRIQLGDTVIVVA